MNKPLTLFAALGFLIFGGACVTPMLYGGAFEQSRTVTETISAFLISQDGKQLVVAGKQHRYIFPLNDTLKFVLAWPERQRVRVAFEDFAINKEQAVFGRCKLSVDAGPHLPLKIEELLLAKGFVREALANGKTSALVYKTWLYGQRHMADKVELAAMQPFSRSYTVTLTEKFVSKEWELQRALLTPLAVTADSFLVIAGFLLVAGVFVVAAGMVIMPGVIVIKALMKLKK